MPRFVALLRGVIVGGRRRLPMADLRALCGEIGLRDAATRLRSGNLGSPAKGRNARTVLALRDLLATS